MQALGLIETRGLLVAIESADAMLKAADVTLLEKTIVGGGLVSIAVTGEVAAVKAAVDAGAAAVRQINGALLVSQHVIPRPHEELDNVMYSVIALSEAEPVTEPVVETEKEAEVEVEAPVELVVEAPVIQEQEVAETDFNKAAVDKMAAEKGIGKAMEVLKGLKVVKLRTLAREYTDFGIAGRLISKADKNMLLVEFKAYYSKK